MNIEPILNLVNKQAEDESIWFDATTITEAYLQERLRDLHRVIEDNIKEVEL